MIEELDEEYRSNEDDEEEADFGGLAAEMDKSPDYFEGLRQRAISDELGNPYVVGEGIAPKEVEEFDDELS